MAQKVVVPARDQGRLARHPDPRPQQHAQHAEAVLRARGVKPGRPRGPRDQLLDDTLDRLGRRFILDHPRLPPQPLRLLLKHRGGQPVAPTGELRHQIHAVAMAPAKKHPRRVPRARPAVRIHAGQLDALVNPPERHAYPGPRLEPSLHRLRRVEQQPRRRVGQGVQPLQLLRHVPFEHHRPMLELQPVAHRRDPLRKLHQRRVAFRPERRQGIRRQHPDRLSRLRRLGGPLNANPVMPPAPARLHPPLAHQLVERPPQRHPAHLQLPTKLRLARQTPAPPARIDALPQDGGDLIA